MFYQPFLNCHRQDHFYKYNCWLVRNNLISHRDLKCQGPPTSTCFGKKTLETDIDAAGESHARSAAKLQQFGVEPDRWRDSGHVCAKSIHIHSVLFIGAAFLSAFVVVWISNSQQTLKSIWYQAIILWYTLYAHITMIITHSCIYTDVYTTFINVFLRN